MKQRRRLFLVVAGPGAAASRVLPMGSAMEGALFVLLEVIVYKPKAMLGVTAEAMRANQTNME